MYYSVNNDTNEQLQRRYLQKLPSNYIVGGRLAAYRYFDMHQVIGSALQMTEKEIKRPSAGVARVHSSNELPRRAA